MNKNRSGGALEVTVTVDEDGQRIDNWLLRRLKGWPRGQVYRLLRSGQVRVNSRRAQPRYRLTGGDRVRMPPQTMTDLRDGTRRVQAPASLQRQLADAILLENDRCLVLDKPAGVAVHGGSGVAFGVIETLRALRPDAPFLELVHRLDRETSGCLLVAKKRSALRELHARFRDSEVEKRYLCLVAGDWQRGRDVVTLPLEPDHRVGGERHVRVQQQGKVAETLFAPVQRYRGATLLEVEPKTGRTHQIRVHAAAVGHPLAGDSRYGDAAFNDTMARLGLRRLFLHAHLLSFTLPGTREPCSASAQLPAELARFLEALAPVR